MSPTTDPSQSEPADAIRVRELAVYPVKGEPGRRLETAHIRAEGLAGDRRKKQPVHIVGSEESPETTRANVFVTAPSDDLTQLLGRHLRLGGATLLVTQIPTGCVGVYAGVVEAGDVGIGDVLDPQDPAPAKS